MSNRNDEMLKEMKAAVSTADVYAVLKKYPEENSDTALGIAFEKLFVNKRGYSARKKIDDLFELHHGYKTKNGKSWARNDAGCYLGKKYIIIKPNAQEKKVQGDYIKIDGFRKNAYAQDIRKDIQDEIHTRPCAVLHITTNIQCDHKDGKKDKQSVADKKSQRLEDFQPLCRTVNVAKRDHCDRCKDSGKRFDARVLGYKEAFIYGDENSINCDGCYWYDPFEFNKVISENFEKED